MKMVPSVNLAPYPHLLFFFFFASKLVIVPLKRLDKTALGVENDKWWFRGSKTKTQPKYTLASKCIRMTITQGKHTNIFTWPPPPPHKAVPLSWLKSCQPKVQGAGCRGAAAMVSNAPKTLTIGATGVVRRVCRDRALGGPPSFLNFCDSKSLHELIKDRNMSEEKLRHLALFKTISATYVILMSSGSISARPQKHPLGQTVCQRPQEVIFILCHNLTCAIEGKEVSCKRMLISAGKLKLKDHLFAFIWERVPSDLVANTSCAQM